MSSIHFCTPVTYDNQIKTISQQALETVDEYFYLGDKFRVRIFSPDAKHPQSWAMQDRQNRQRSWRNAIKVASYCTFILPLIGLLIKAALRCYLQVASIKLDSRFLPSSQLEAKLLTDSVKYIGSFLSYQDQGQFAQVGVFARDAARETEQNHIECMAPLKKEIQALPIGPLSREHLQRLLVGLVTSPAIGHPKHWIPIMETLMGRLALDDDIDAGIQTHAHIADLLATSEQPISSDQIYQFCRYLGQKHLSKRYLWIGYRDLEQYLLKPKLDFASVNKALKEYLTQQAEKHIMAENSPYYLSNNRMFETRETCIDPRQWFGFNGENSSLWRQPGAANSEIAPMPELLLEVLWTRIQSLRASCMDRPFMVGMERIAEARLPRNFTLPLAKRITNASIFLDHHNTVDTEELEKPDYARSLNYLDNLDDEALEKVAQQYPNAIIVEQ